MLYDFTMCHGDDRGSIRLVRTYYKSKPLSTKAIQDVTSLLIQACDAVSNDNNVLIEEDTYLEFGEAWVKDTQDETLKFLLAQEAMIDTTAMLDGMSVREITRKLLTDLVSTNYWASYFEGAKDAFKALDLNDFVTAEERVDNDNLKVPIGNEIYVPGWGSNVFIYQGRPNKEQMEHFLDPHFGMEYGVWATDNQIIAVSDFKVADYIGDMETFPLPLASLPDTYFSREKSDSQHRKESTGRTASEAQMKLALRMAFAALG